jgi:hypothetical protein
MVIHSEQGVWQGQNHPCYGAHPSEYGFTLMFRPWVYDGTHVRWGPGYETHSEALLAAKRLAGHDV